MREPRIDQDRCYHEADGSQGMRQGAAQKGMREGVVVGEPRNRWGESG